MQFNQLPLHANLLKAIAEENYRETTLVQEKTIPLVLAKKDLIVSAQTGTGKTAAFALPILQMLLDSNQVVKHSKKIKALILSPTRELAQQIGQNINTYSRYTNITTGVLFGGIPLDPQIALLKKGIDILVATPGRFLDLYKQEQIQLNNIETLVLDEADLMLDMGFMDDVNKVISICPTTKQTLLFSATIPPEIKYLVKATLNDPETVDINPEAITTKNIKQKLYYVHKKDKIELCLNLLKNTINGRVIIFRRTKHGVDKLEQTLLKNNYKTIGLHGDKTQVLRQEALSKFKRNDVNILIATDVAARGIDIDDIDAVLNFDIPNIPETYVHRIGRTGRAGKSGMAHSLCSADEKMYVKAIQKTIEHNIPIEENHPYPLAVDAKPEVHKSTKSKYKKGRKSENSKKKKKRWY